MKLVFIVEDAEHDKNAKLNIKKEAKNNHVSDDDVINDISDQFYRLGLDWGLNCYLTDIEEKENK